MTCCASCWSFLCPFFGVQFLGASCGQSRAGSPTVLPSESVGDSDAHAAGGAFDDLHCRVEVVGVEVRQLRGGDVPYLIAADLANLVAMRHARALWDTSGLLNQLSCWRRLGDEAERAVLVDRD